MRRFNNNYDFIVTKDDIYIAEVISFSKREGGHLVYKDLTKKETFRKVLVKEKEIIDFKTGNIIYPLYMKDNTIDSTIFKDYFYCINLIKPDIRKISDKDLIYAYNLYAFFLEKRELINQKKLILFPPTRLN